MKKNQLNFLIALGLGLVSVPSQAESTIYATLQTGLVNTDTGGTSNAEIKSLASRFGFKAETELNNGLTGFGNFEFGLETEGDDVVTRRLGNIGLKGGFGTLTIGQAYHTFYNYAVGPNDNPWWGSGWATQSYTGRTEQGLSYAGGNDSISFGITTYLQAEGDEGLDGSEIGASFGIGEMTLGVAIQDMETDADPTTGLALSGLKIGDSVTLGFGFQSKGDDSSILIDSLIGNGYVHYEAMNQDVGASPTSITLGYTHSLGDSATAWFEFQSVDADTDNSDNDETYIRAMLKYDIL